MFQPLFVELLQNPVKVRFSLGRIGHNFRNYRNLVEVRGNHLREDL